MNTTDSQLFCSMSTAVATSMATLIANLTIPIDGAWIPTPLYSAQQPANDEVLQLPVTGNGIKVQSTAEAACTQLTPKSAFDYGA
ncbi:hypothetical protein [Prosthecobacter sp.]|uniref:hypothetical protein n=1 Tax=Prosthecobacter sp. TaxID=1965333 RepID=UPI003783FDAF